MRSQKEGERSRKGRQSVGFSHNHTPTTPQVRTTNSNAAGSALTGQTDKLKSSLNDSGKLTNSAVIEEPNEADHFIPLLESDDRNMYQDARRHSSKEKRNSTKPPTIPFSS